jgi:branched-chain amino acid transport system ATP-binding protein
MRNGQEAETAQMRSAPETTSNGRLRAEGVRVHFEGVKALDGVDLELRSGEILGLIGPNGAGKTTLVNVLTGFQRASSGSISIGGRDVTGATPERHCTLGLARTFQGVRLFGGLSVCENVEVAAASAGVPSSEAPGLAAELLGRLHLAERADLPAAALPHGEERRLGIARALATRPRFLLLDEPAAGLDEAESDQLVHALAAIRDDFTLALLVIEHDMRLIMQLCERIQVLDYGRTIAIGTPAEVRRDPEVLKAYLGTERELGLASG